LIRQDVTLTHGTKGYQRSQRKDVMELWSRDGVTIADDTAALFSDTLTPFGFRSSDLNRANS